MEIRKVVVFLVCAFVCAYGQGELGHPDLPTKFSAKLRLGWGESNTTTECTLTYDSQMDPNDPKKRLGRGRVGIQMDFPVVGSMQFLVDANTEEVVIIDRDECVVKPLTKDFMLNDVYSLPIDLENGQMVVRKIVDFFQLNGAQIVMDPEQVPNEYSVVNGINADNYQKIIKNKLIGKDTYDCIINSYFASNGWWPHQPQCISATGCMPMPVQMRVNCTGLSDPSKVIQHSSDFFEYRPNEINEELFQIPSGIFCKGKKPGKPLPDIDTNFAKFTTVSDGEDNGDRTELTITYDANNKIIGHYSINLNDKGISVEESTILDYNLGISVDMETAGADCQITKFRDSSQMMKLKAFLLDKDWNTAEIYYVGQRECRAMKCDVWSMMLPDQPTVMKRFSEIYFLLGKGEQSILPYQIETFIKILDENGVEQSQTRILQSYYDAHTAIDTTALDIGDCLRTDVAFVAMTATGNFKNLDQYENAIISDLKNKLKDKMGLKSFLRMSSVRLFAKDNEKGFATLIFRDKITQSPVDDATFHQAILSLKKSIDAKTFSFGHPNDDKIKFQLTGIKLYVSENSNLREDDPVEEPSNGGGSGTGLAVGMFFLGLAVAFIAAFLIVKFVLPSNWFFQLGGPQAREMIGA